MADFVAIDFETANEKGESACALGIAHVKGNEIVTTDSWLIRPPDEYFTIRKRNREIHGLGRSALKNQQQFSELWPTVAPYFTNRIVVAHNAASTEINILRKLFTYFSIEPPDFKYLCTLQLARASSYESLEKCSLEQVAKFLGCEFSHHNPMDDARVCASFLIRACNDASVNSVEELAESIGVTVNPFSLVKEEPRSSYGGGEIYGMKISLEDMGVSIGYFDDDQPEARYGFTIADIQIRPDDTGVYSRGEELFSKNKVQITSKSDVTYEGLVAGSGKTHYEVSVDASLTAECTCPAWRNSRTRFCKHCVALALVWEAAGGPTPINELSADDKKAAIVHTIQQLSPNECKEILIELAENEPDLTTRLLFDENSTGPTAARPGRL